MSLGEDLDRLEGSRKRSRSLRSPKNRILGVRSEYSLPDSQLVPKYDLSGLTYTDFALKELRPKDRFYFEVDVPHSLKGEEKATAKANLLRRILAQLPKDFKRGYEVEETADGYHLVSRIKPRDFNKYFAKYKALFPESDFVNTGPDRLGLRISPKLNLKTGDPDAPAPKVIISTFRTPRRRAPKSVVYLTNPAIFVLALIASYIFLAHP